MSATVIRADARNLPLADNSVDLVVTSPPYFALRSYQDGGEHYDGQIGAEPTPAEFVASLLEVTRECMRVLKPSGSLWVNLGDKYAGSRMDGSSGNGSSGSLNTRKVDGEKLQVVEIGAEGQGRKADAGRIPTKSLIGIPWRYALACIDDLGLILRAEVIWSKPNGLPESVTDRVRRSHEQWFHFTLSPRYFSAVDEIREPYDGDGRKRGRSPHTTAGHPNSGGHDGLNLNGNENPLGKLPGSVWRIDDAELGQPGRPGAGDRGCTCGADQSGRDRTSGHRRAGASGLPEGAPWDGLTAESVWEVPTEPLRVPDHLGIDHFAAFPTEWPKRIIQGWSPAGVCVECGDGRRPVGDRERVVTQRAVTPSHKSADNNRSLDPDFDRKATLVTITGYACACGTQQGDTWTPATSVAPSTASGGQPVTNAADGGASFVHPEMKQRTTSPDTRPAVVLDPFGGTGTTAMVAKALGRHGISVDMSADYCRLAEWRTTDRNQIAKVLGVAKVEQQPDDQLGLWETA